ncbi:fatty acid desaturase family protein [Compostibacter hankyongensis]|uniref:Acyl-CoA desaturase n=1 Tax=Compostibacter hankyongensis TaxID=1007089 RepID=A0ABP8FDB9_9BACT
MEKTLKPVFVKSPDDTVFLRIKKRVSDKVRELEPRRRATIVFKAILFPLVYIAAYVLALCYGRQSAVLYGAYFLMGIMLVLIFLNQIHDAVHGVLWKSPRLNKLYVHFFDLMGANSYVWKVRHTRLHHNYPNIMGWDSDIEQSTLARIFPHGPFSRIHRYQHIYLPLIYPLYLLNWLLVRDFKDFFNRSKPVWKVVDIPRSEYIKLFIFKAFFLFYIIVLPVLVLKISLWKAIGVFLIMMFTASIFSLLVLLSPHANTENEFPLPDERLLIGHPWFVHQIRNTNDVIHDNWFIRFFMGSFNYHVVHHLFPKVNHVFYPEATAILREEAARHNLPYHSYPLVTTLVNHYRLLKQNRIPENIFEETM